MRRLPPLSALKAFEAAARHGSFKRAADELAVSPTAISHQIRALEAYMGVSLFGRQVRQVKLTDAGAQLFPVLQDGFDGFERVIEQLRHTSRRSRVTLTATSAFTAKWLMPRVAAFHVLHPDIDLHLHASDEAVDMTDRTFDIALRYGQGPYPGLITEAMFTDTFAPVMNPRLGIASIDALGATPLIHFEWKRPSPLNPTWQHWFAQAGMPWNPALGHVRYSDEAHAIQAAVAGQGVALLSLDLVAEELAAGHLVQPFGPMMTGHTYHLATRADAAPSSAVKAVIDWLRGAAQDTRDRHIAQT